MDKKALWEAIKEPLRLLVLAIIPVLIAYFLTLPYGWAALAVLALRFVDKYLHEVQTAKPESRRREGLLGIRGLTGF